MLQRQFLPDIICVIFQACQFLVSTQHHCSNQFSGTRRVMKEGEKNEP